MSIDGFNPYIVLGVSYGCTDKEARFAALKKIKEQHPDKGGTGDDDLLRVIEAKKIFGNPEYRACFKDCFRSNRKLEESWNTYKNRLNELENDPEGPSSDPQSDFTSYGGDQNYETSNSNQNRNGDHKNRYSSRKSKRSNQSRHKHNAKYYNDTDYWSENNFHGDAHYYDNNDHGDNYYHGYNSYHEYEDFGTNSSKRRRSSRTTNNYEWQRKRQHEQDELYKKKMKEKAEEIRQQSQHKRFDGNYRHQNQDESRSKKEKRHHGSDSWEEPDFQDSHQRSSYDYQTHFPSYVKTDIPETVIDLTGDEFDFENIEIHDYSNQNDAKYANQNTDSETCNLQWNSRLDETCGDQTQENGEVDDLDFSKEDSFCEELIFGFKTANEKFEEYKNNSINQPLSCQDEFCRPSLVPDANDSTGKQCCTDNKVFDQNNLQEAEQEYAYISPKCVDESSDSHVNTSLINLIPDANIKPLSPTINEVIITGFENDLEIQKEEASGAQRFAIPIIEPVGSENKPEAARSTPPLLINELKKPQTANCMNSFTPTDPVCGFIGIEENSIPCSNNNQTSVPNCENLNVINTNEGTNIELLAKVYDPNLLEALYNCNFS